jgi:hypothetical protein
VGQKRESGEFRKWKQRCSPRSNLAQADDVEFRITVNVTGGWIGFGFSPNGGMRGSDIVLAWLNADGSPSFSDRHATANALPSVDKQQDYELLELSQDARAATTTLRFRRKLTTCDADDALLSGTARVIYAWGVETPVDGVPRYHEARRGSRSVNILNEAPLGAPPTERDVQLFDIVFNNTLAPKQYGRTRYLLKAFQFPLFEKHHVVGSQMLIPESELPAAHHMLVYLCNFPLNETELAYAGPKRGAPQSLRSCNLVRPIAGWAVGGLDVWLPKEFGFPVGQDENNRFVVCELHLDVAAEDEDYFTRVGIRFHVTKTLRPHDGAVVSIGANVDNFLLVAPNAQVQRRGYCVSECTTEGLIPKEGMLIFGTMLHGHTAATAIEVRHIRADGVELAPLARDATYDFNLQNWNWLAQPRLFSPGDQFVTTCNYSTLGRTVPTLGGEATSEEMCLVYMLTYSPSGPVEINTCMSTGTPNLLATLILNNAFAGATPTSFFNTSDFFRNNVSDWSKYETVLQNALNSNTPTVQPFCLKNSGNFTFGLGRNVRSFRPRVPYVEPQLCAVPTTVAATSTAPPSTSTDTAASTTSTAAADRQFSLLRLNQMASLTVSPGSVSSFKLDIPADTENWSATMRAIGPAKAKLLIRRDGFPNERVAQWTSSDAATVFNWQTVIGGLFLEFPVDGTWHLVVEGAAAGEVELTIKSEPLAATALAAATPYVSAAVVLVALVASLSV